MTKYDINNIFIINYYKTFFGFVGNYLLQSMFFLHLILVFDVYIAFATYMIQRRVKTLFNNITLIFRVKSYLVPLLLLLYK